MLTRRFFMRGSALALAGAGTAPIWLQRAAAATQTRRKVLVAIFQRGAADALNIVVPFGDPHYAELRPTIGIPAPNKFANGQPALDLDGYFGLHPALEPLKSLWESKNLAVVHAAGSPDPSRSHFDAQEYMESGTPGAKRDGWLNRALPAPSDTTSPLRAISLGATLPRTLQGDRSAIAIADLQQYQAGQGSASIVESLYAGADDPRLSRAGKDAFSAMRMLKSLDRERPMNGANNPYLQGGELGRSLQQIARLIKADVGVEAAFAEVGGWDHHQNENGQLFGLLRSFGNALSAFAKDLGDRMEDVVLVTMSEFGRTARENGNSGTDHGHGGAMFVLGGPVAGGKVYGQWPGLAEEELFERRDLAVTTDFRAVLSELVGAQLGATNIGDVFPGYHAAGALGLIRT